MKSPDRLLFHRACFGVLIAANVILAPLGRAAVGLTISPSVISNTYGGQITLQITGLTNGETVLLEHVFDANTNGVIDAGESLVQSFSLTDGRVASFGGVRDVNVPGDEDGAANGQVQAKLVFANSAEFARGAGTHLFRVSSPGGHFSAVTQPLNVTQTALSQRITGQINGGGSGVPFATVALLVQVGQDIKFIAGAGADASGNFSITAAPGTYLVLAAKPGWVSDLAVAPVVALGAGQVVTQNLSLTASTRTASGRITDAVSGLGIPGVQLFIQSTTANTIAFAFSDAGGNFTAALIAGEWKVDISDFSLNQIGYLRPQNKVKFDTTAGNVTGLIVTLTRETALIYGSVKDSANNALGGVSIFAGDSNGQNESSGVTDTNGNYSLGVTAGIWAVQPDAQNPALAGYVVQGTNVTLAADQALRVNFVAQRATAHLLGRVVDSGGNGVSDLLILANPQSGGSSASALTAADGSFDIGVFGGAWSLQLETSGAAQRNLVGPVLPFNVTDGVNISNITYGVRSVTAQINGSVRNGAAQPLANVNVYASITVNGTNYNAAGQTDASGNYQVGVFNGTWQVNLDCFTLSSLGYGCPASQNATVSGANVTVNFIAPPLAQLSFLFRHFALGGDFGSGLTPVPAYPVSVNGYVAMLEVQNDSDFPPEANVFFTGPSGSGLTGTPAVSASTNGSPAFYFAPRINSPPAGPGGPWTVIYKNYPNNFNVPDPQVATRLVIPLPTVTLNGGNVASLNWAYRDRTGAALGGPPAFVTGLQVQIFDGDPNLIDVSDLLPTATTSYAPLAAIPWSSVRRVRLNYIDTLNNRYFVTFNRTSGALSGAVSVSNNRFEFVLNGLAGQNYTVQYSTTLTNWATLYITNAPAGSFVIDDPAATNAYRFYRALSGP